MCEILSGLWIGDINISKRNDFHLKNNIQFSINCENSLSYLTNITHEKLKKYNISLDSISSKMINYWIEESKKIYKNLIEFNGVLIYCNDLEKSCSLLLAYLIIYGSLNLENSINVIRSKLDDTYYPNQVISYALKHLHRKINL